ncbi:MAG: HupE/UreJ family protein [Prochlorococcaceae cyanobacterium]|jgi:urease accessory protein
MLRSFPSTAPRSLLLAGAAGLGLSLLSTLPAAAHGVASTGLLGGAAHPLMGLDHLLLLVGVGAAASSLGADLLLFALVGAVTGALLGAGGIQIPLAETLAALAVAGVGLLVFRAQRQGRPALLPLVGTPLALAVAIHALLHGQEAAGPASWWLGAALASAAVVLVSFTLLRRLPPVFTTFLGLLLGLSGGLLALAPLA